MYWIYIYKKHLFLQTCLQNLFELLTWTQKMMFWHTFWCIFVRISATAPPCRPPSFCSVLLLLQTTRRREKSRPAVIRSPVKCQLTFQSVSGLRPSRVRGDGCFSVECALALSKCTDVATPFWTALYYTPVKRQERWVYTLWKRGQHWTDPSTWQTSQTLFHLGLKPTLAPYDRSVIYFCCTKLRGSLWHAWFCVLTRLDMDPKNKLYVYNVSLIRKLRWR